MRSTLLAPDSLTCLLSRSLLLLFCCCCVTGFPASFSQFEHRLSTSLTRTSCTSRDLRATGLRTLEAEGTKDLENPITASPTLCFLCRWRAFTSASLAHTRTSAKESVLLTHALFDISRRRREERRTCKGGGRETREEDMGSRRHPTSLAMDGGSVTTRAARMELRSSLSRSLFPSLSLPRPDIHAVNRTARHQTCPEPGG